ncbi:ABC transporter permease [Bartonella sp. HY329]|uniref:ABC transporter permease n=1 Tax=unclassified Bartonella TaxID=2645622 RepID=UPI0021C5F38B|nr:MULTISPECIES: ABC transporter permease [unclassified Bartonella]UXM95867.1 ABC transporter permease [Bartonella sp. HY329]UXN10192.1 ABC transporter permease [Bartonella sp. HY328]
MGKLIGGLLIVCILALCSIFVGVGSVTPSKLWALDHNAWTNFLGGRIPRTVALILVGVAMTISGTIMQLLSRNRFVEPSTAGTVDSASLGILAVLLLAPDLPVILKTLVAAGFALCGTFIFMAILRRIPLRSALLVPLIGIMLSGVIGSISTFFAYKYDKMQSLQAWLSGDFSSVMLGKYELLWLAVPLVLIACIAADRFTVAGLGQDFTTNLGVNYKHIMMMGLMIVAMNTALVVIITGQIPFLGLIIPNIVALFIGDNMRRAVPWVALLGASSVLICDILSRLISYPYEIPISAIIGVFGSGIFLYLLLRKGNRFA